MNRCGEIVISGIATRCMSGSDGGCSRQRAEASTATCSAASAPAKALKAKTSAAAVSHSDQRNFMAVSGEAGGSDRGRASPQRKRSRDRLFHLVACPASTVRTRSRSSVRPRRFVSCGIQRPCAARGRSSTAVAAAPALRVKAMAAAASQSIQRGFMAVLCNVGWMSVAEIFARSALCISPEQGVDGVAIAVPCSRGEWRPAAGGCSPRAARRAGSVHRRARPRGRPSSPAPRRP